MMKPGTSRDSLAAAVKEMRNYYASIEVEYSSYVDGNCEDGIVAEQFVSK